MNIHAAEKKGGQGVEERGCMGTTLELREDPRLQRYQARAVIEHIALSDTTCAVRTRVLRAAAAAARAIRCFRCVLKDAGLERLVQEVNTEYTLDPLMRASAFETKGRRARFLRYGACGCESRCSAHAASAARRAIDCAVNGLRVGCALKHCLRQRHHL